MSARDDRSEPPSPSPSPEKSGAMDRSSRSNAWDKREVSSSLRAGVPSTTRSTANTELGLNLNHPPLDVNDNDDVGKLPPFFDREAEQKECSFSKWAVPPSGGNKQPKGSLDAGGASRDNSREQLV